MSTEAILLLLGIVFAAVAVVFGILNLITVVRFVVGRIAARRRRRSRKVFDGEPGKLTKEQMDWFVAAMTAPSDLVDPEAFERDRREAREAWEKGQGGKR